jgi:hypothetical protein
MDHEYDVEFLGKVHMLHSGSFLQSFILHVMNWFSSPEAAQEFISPVSANWLAHLDQKRECQHP